MRFAVIGAGGIGSFYGAKLVTAGHDVVFVARGKHLAAILRNGLTIRHDVFNFHQSVYALNLKDFLEVYRADEIDVLLLCTKAQNTTVIAQQLQSWMNNLKTLIVSLQNGVENEEILGQYINPKQIIGGIARRIGAHIESPGVITAKGIGELLYGAYPNHHVKANQKTINAVIALKSVFEAADIPTFIETDIKKALWRKLVINNGVNPLTALTGLDTRTVSSRIGLSEMVYGMMQEAVKAAQLKNVGLTRTDADDMYVLIQTFDAIKTSMQVDVENDRPIELEEIAGVVLRTCEKHRVPAPFTHSVYHLLKAKQQGLIMV